MRFKRWTHKNVNIYGVLKSGGSVSTKKEVITSLTNKCTIESCKCHKVPWMSINFGYNKKKKSVSGITFYFSEESEFNFIAEKF